jgi:hypothetical protein
MYKRGFETLICERDIILLHPNIFIRRTVSLR